MVDKWANLGKGKLKYPECHIGPVSLGREIQLTTDSRSDVAEMSTEASHSYSVYPFCSEVCASEVKKVAFLAVNEQALA